MKQNTEVLRDSQKKRMIKWEIPHLMGLLKKKWQLASMHLITAPFPILYQRDWFFLDGKLGFPLFAGNQFFGVLICFRPGSENFLFSGGDFKEVAFSKEVKEELELGKNIFPREIRIFIDRYLQSLTFLESDQKNLEAKKLPAILSPGEKINKELFPVLLRKNKKEELLKMAHDLYLNTSAFAFLNTEDFKWKKGVFREMNGVFVCIPSFKELSDFQKTVLKQALLKKSLPSFLVMGFPEKEKLPKEWTSLFSFKDKVSSLNH